MDVAAFLLAQHAAMHARDVSGRAHPAERVFAGLEDEQMRARPAPGLNSLVWLLWHMARTEDVAVNLVVAGRDQVLDDAWMRRMNAPWRHIGSGMTETGVIDLTARADVAAVRAYRSAVGLRTREVVAAFGADAWADVVNAEDIRRAGRLGAFLDWVDGAGYPWLGRSRAEQLASSAVSHNAAHVGEAVTIRGLAGFPLAG